MARDHLLYFGKTMPFTDNSGTEHPESFWHMQNFSIDTDNRILHMNFVAYASIAAFNAQQESLVKKGGSWTKNFTGEAYDRLIEMFALTVASVSNSTWAIAGSVKDKPNAENEFESFFENAGEIILPEELRSALKK